MSKLTVYQCDAPGCTYEETKLEHLAIVDLAVTIDSKTYRLSGLACKGMRVEPSENDDGSDVAIDNSCAPKVVLRLATEITLTAAMGRDIPYNAETDRVGLLDE